MYKGMYCLHLTFEDVAVLQFSFSWSLAQPSDQLSLNYGLCRSTLSYTQGHTSSDSYVRTYIRTYVQYIHTHDTEVHTTLKACYVRTYIYIRTYVQYVRIHTRQRSTYVSQETRIFPQACCTWYPRIAEQQAIGNHNCPADRSPCTHGERKCTVVSSFNARIISPNTVRQYTRSTVTEV